MSKWAIDKWKDDPFFQLLDTIQEERDNQKKQTKLKVDLKANKVYVEGEKK